MPTVLITGSSRGLGYHLHRVLVERSWQTFPLVRNERDASALKQRHPDCCPVITDVACDSAVADIRRALHGRVRRLDVLVNNAGFGGTARRVEDVTSEELLGLLQVHCLGAMRCTKAVLPLLEPGSKVVNVTSRLGSMARNAGGHYPPGSFSYTYRIAKAAQNMFTLCLSQQLRERSVAVYGIHPGRLLTASAAHDADTRPELAAERLADWIESATLEMSGMLFEPTKGEIPW
jgi:NAD(P)-dependent dehydrogenase (short-subunit alcohol dehydrogenase family)